MSDSKDDMNDKSKESSGFSTDKKGSGFSTEKKGSGFSTDKKGSGFSTEKKDSGFSTDKKGSGFSTDKKGSGFSTEKKVSGLSTEKKGSGFSNDKKGSGISTDKKGSGVSSDKKGAGVSSDKKGAGVSTEKNAVDAKPLAVSNGDVKSNKGKVILLSLLGIAVVCLVGYFLIPEEGTQVTSIAGVDSDKDGLSDAYETSNGLNSDDPSDGSADKDGDGLSNLDEMIAGTDVSNADSDGDGQSDGAEIASNSDPKDETSNYVDNESESFLDSNNSPNGDTSAKNNEGSTKSKQISRSSLSFSSGDDIYYFIIGSSYISQSDSKLIQLAKELKSSNLKVTLIGHTDNTGSTTFNMRLANLRAKKISSFLIAQGVDSSQITTKSEGESNPLYPNNNAENKRKNRRVEIVY